MKRSANAIWKGNGLEGSGMITTPSSVLNQTPYNTKLRFQDEEGRAGTNPEELVAAAHAGCFAMALSFAIAGAGFTADTLDVTATLTIEREGTAYTVTNIVLHLTGKVPGLSEEQFMELANGAKVNCPISKALSAVPIDLDATFIAE